MDDRIALRIALAILAVLAISQLLATRAAAAEPFVAGDYCSTPETMKADRATWSRADRKRTRQRVWDACKAVGGSDVYCRWHDATVVRESWGGVASAVHTLAEGEYGLGPQGLFVRVHAGKWPGDDEDPEFCTPEVSFLVSHDIAWRAVERYGARTPVQIQAIFGGGRGSHACWTEGYPDWVFDTPVLDILADVLGLRRSERVCVATPSQRHIDAVCRRMGVDCTRPISPKDLGRKVPMSERRAWARRQASR